MPANIASPSPALFHTTYPVEVPGLVNVMRPP